MGAGGNGNLREASYIISAVLPVPRLLPSIGVMVLCPFCAFSLLEDRGGRGRGEEDGYMCALPRDHECGPRACRN